MANNHVSKKMQMQIANTRRQNHFMGGQIHNGFNRVLRKDFALSNGRGYCKQCDWEWFANTGEVINKTTHKIIHKNENKLDDSFSNLKKVTLEEAKKLRYKQVSKTLKGHKLSHDTKIKISEKLKGKSFLTDEGRKKLSEAGKSRIYTDEMKKQMSETQKRLFHSGKKKMFGKNNPAWKGGIWRNQGYIYIHKPGFPTANAKGYIKRANYIWFQRTGQIIKPPFLLHHKNGNKEDDRYENLHRTTREKHIKIHREYYNEEI